MPKISISISKYFSPCGELIIGSYSDKLCLCDWAVSSRHAANISSLCLKLNTICQEGTSGIISRASTWLDEYFAGGRHDFDIPILLTGTDFQCRIWAELSRIPYGTTISYSQLARRIGNPAAVRAVASAVASNPISIFVPCHRIIGSDGKLTGYAGGLPAKRLLLDLEAEAENTLES